MGDPSDATPITIGRVFADKYQIDGLLGNGGMGIVLVATHLQLHTKVAIKLLRAEMQGTGTATERLLREARATARINSKNVARILDVSSSEWGGPYIVIEYLEGMDLGAYLRANQRLPVSEAVGYLLQACEGIRAAHALGIIHRDLKPSNLFRTKDESGAPLIKVLDFGISKQLEGEGDRPYEAALTRTDSMMGSPVYMPPEQLRDPRSVDLRSDIWSLGTILFELLSGRLPFQATTLPQLCTQILHENPESLRQYRWG